MKIWIVCPCYYDAVSFGRLREEARRVLSAAHPGSEWTFVVSDDSAGADSELAPMESLPDVRVIRTPYNLGHQGALVFALRSLADDIRDEDFVVTMDSDGQDRPEDLPVLLAPLVASGGNLRLVSLARRASRKESVAFKIFYLFFRMLFFILTGTVIRNGNYAAYRGRLLHELLFHPHFDQCYSSSFTSLPLQVEMVPLARGDRYAGRSRMGYMGLFTHGIRMLMPFSERIAMRGMIFATVVGMGCVGAGVFAAIRGRSLALPLFGVLLATLILGVSVLLFATFSQTKSRSLRGLHEPSSGR